MGEPGRRDNAMQRQGREVADLKANTATRTDRTGVERTPVVEELPPDQFNAVVESDMDRARLLWLVNRIGEVKLRKSVAKYQARRPGQQPFVSTLLKWYNLRVPVAVFAPVRIPVYWLYLLYARDGSEVKAGITGDWPWRAYSWVPLHHAVADVFDLDRSRAFLVGGNKAEVLRREQAIKRAFAPLTQQTSGRLEQRPYGVVLRRPVRRPGGNGRFVRC